MYVCMYVFMCVRAVGFVSDKILQYHRKHTLVGSSSGRERPPTRWREVQVWWWWLWCGVICECCVVMAMVVWYVSVVVCE